MPAGPGPLGFAYFVGAKFAGYSAYCAFVLQRKAKSLLPEPSPVTSGMRNSYQADPKNPLVSPWVAGATRTAIGLIVGAIVGLSFWKIPFFSHRDSLDITLFYCLLVPVRVGEWWLLIRIFYRDLLQHRKLATIMIIAGILVSFGLDALGIFTAFVMPGEMWVC